MNFFEHQDQARRQSRWLIVLFILAVLAIVVAVDFVMMLVLGLNSDSLANGPALFSPAFLASNWQPLAFGSAGTAGLIGLSSLFKVASLRAGGGKVARDLGGTLVDSDTRDPLRRRLRNVVEEIALAAGVPVPEIYVLEQEPGINAFAAGFSPSDAAIAVTRGTLEKLDRNELQGVIAHEFSHIFNGDMRLNIRLMGVLFGILLLAIIGRKVLHGARYTRSSKEGGAGAIVVIALAVMLIGYIGLFFGRWIKAAVSRRREYLADASAVQFTRHPEGIAGALKKIAVYSNGSYLETDAEEVAHMLFGQGQAAHLFATHPPLLERIRRIQPDFQEEELKILAQRLERQSRQEAEREEREAKQEQRDGLFDARNIIDQIGNPDWDKLLMAALLAGSIPDDVQAAAHSTEWAPEVLFLLLLDPKPEIREQQLLIVAQRMGDDSERQVRALQGTMPEVAPEQRLALMELAFPALKRRPREYLEELLETVQGLIQADGRIELYEYVLAKLVRVYLTDAMNPRQSRSSGKLDLDDCRAEVVQLTAILAAHGHERGRDGRTAFSHGLQTMGLPADAQLSAPADWQAALDTTLEKLDRLKPKAKEKLVAGLIETVTHDQQVTSAEAELLRAVCAAIHTPLPILAS